MFLVNSRRGRFSETSLGSPSELVHPGRFPLFRSYGDILPSSLTSILPSAFGCSPCRPVLVLVRIPDRLARRYFLEDVPTTYGLMPRTRLWDRIALDLPGAIPPAWTTRSYGFSWPSHPLTAIAQTPAGSTGILTGRPSSTPFGLDLGSD